MDQLSHKPCSRCAAVKPVSEFYKMPTSGDGLRPDCKECIKGRMAEIRQKARAAKPPRELSTSYFAIHFYLLTHYPKTGICEDCGQPGKTEHALIHGREYSRNREDYRELCPPCHGKYDHGGERSYAAKLTPEQVAEIRRRFVPRSTGPNGRKALASEFGVHANTIWNITSGRNWTESAG